MARIYRDITETIGNTPLVRLNRIVPRDGAQVVVKVESFNPLSSVKDRIAVSMIDAAEHGYLLPTEILENEKHMVNCARIGLDFYFVEPQTKEIFRVVSGQLWREAR